MIKKITQFKRFLKELRDNQVAIRSGQQQLYATLKLQSIFDTESFIPQTGWSLQPKALLHILNIISINKRKSIIEFGAGATTLYIAKLLQIENSNATFISIESDLDWLETLRSKLVENNLDHLVTLVHSPIEEIDPIFLFEEQKTWYAQSPIEDVIKNFPNFDMVIVDGPFGGSTPYARYSAMPFLKAKTNEDTFWILDDTNRLEENKILLEWKELTGLVISRYNRYSILTKKSNFDISSFKI